MVTRIIVIIMKGLKKIIIYTDFLITIIRTY